ncbi:MULTISPECIES: translation initiation factor IF-6 [Acidianus]|uniref:Translation initiation factor 6 n=1 Tax=Candidatus Acidianus copahuensis TaxID=1160895 RepID=A0A031LQA2_9CREN|nr:MULTISPECIES: translation initiation factor IF-6 [Acidianus]EZQ06905.1 translation initiation factor IF-6 [Candidatus Acidianus copahuensis]NON61401.1 translation initiation factor IF-6 [Acidianus sp. RZ1]
MNVQRISIFGTDNIGVYMFSNDKYSFIPPGLDKDVKEAIQENLKTEIIETTVSDSFLLGVLICGNNDSILLPRSVRDDEVSKIKMIAKDSRIQVIDIKATALGNTILTNDNGALIYPDFSEVELKKIKEALNMDNVIKGRIAHVSVVGSVGVVTKKGGVVHIDATEEEIKSLENLFKVKIDIGTVNFGSAFIRSGLVANSNGVLIGSSTTGPEILRIQNALS